MPHLSCIHSFYFTSRSDSKSLCSKNDVEEINTLAKSSPAKQSQFFPRHFASQILFSFFFVLFLSRCLFHTN